MNLDELVKNVISAEEGHLLRNQSSSSSSSSPSIFHTNVNSNRNLSKKNTDQLWNENVHPEYVNASQNQSVPQQSSPEETTLEDFLIHSGVIGLSNQGSVINISPQPLMAIDPMVLTKQPDKMQFHMGQGMGPLHHHQQQQHEQQEMTSTMAMQAVVDSNFQGYGDLIMEVGYSGDHMMTMPVQAVGGTNSEDSQVGTGKKRGLTDEIMEKTIERRQKRMIKNRESAARSRARKQAYTNRLEHEAFQLRRTNIWLKKQKEMERLLYSNSTSQPRYQLRRTSSAPF